MAISKWDSAWTNRGTVLGTELDSLANSGYTATGTEVANQTNLDKFGKLELTVTFGSAPASGGYVYVYMLTAPDGTNYEDGSASVVPGNHKIIAVLPVRAVTTAQRITSHIFDLEPAKTKFMLWNGSNVSFPASGSVLKLHTQNDETA